MAVATPTSSSYRRGVADTLKRLLRGGLWPLRVLARFYRLLGRDPASGEPGAPSSLRGTLLEVLSPLGASEEQEADEGKTALDRTLHEHFIALAGMSASLRLELVVLVVFCSAIAWPLVAHFSISESELAFPPYPVVIAAGLAAYLAVSFSQSSQRPATRSRSSR